MPNNRGQEPRATSDSDILKTWQSAFFSRLLDRIDPHGPSNNPEAQHAQVFCGRWLAFQRLRMGLTVEELALRISTDPQSIFLIESGLADPQLLSDDASIRLQQVLAHGQDPLWVKHVVALALGQGPFTLDSSVVEQVQAELDQAYSDEPSTVVSRPDQPSIDVKTWL